MIKPLIKRLIPVILFLLSLTAVAQTTVNFNCGAPTNWTVPACVTSISVTMSGAQGGGSAGGMGASISGTYAVTPGQVLQITVGCQPSGVAGGGGGGGAGANASGGGNSSFGGGGASSISIGGTPVIVAGGGGGTGGGDTDGLGGDGGCPNGTSGSSPYGQGGFGASTTAGGAGGPPWISSGNTGNPGSLGQGGAGASDPCYNLGPGGGGGGGYYGGGGGGSDCFGSAPLGGGGGGGGSSLVPVGFSCAGNHAGNGALSITYTGGVGVATASNGGPYCAGQTIQLNSTGGPPYNWSGPGGYTSTTQNPTRPTSTVAMSGVYTVTVGSGGCTATATTNVVVNPSPTVTVNSATICPGSSATLTASGATSYNWSPSTGLSGTTGPSVTANPASTTTYTVVGTTGTCTNAATAVVTVGGVIAPTVNSPTICLGNSVTLTATGGTTYNWSPGTGLSSTSGATVTANPSTTTVYTITAASGSCSGTTTSTVTVVNNPTVTVASATICAGNSTPLTANGATTYAWSPATGLSATTGSNVNANPGSTTTYTITGTIGTCTDVTTATVNVNPLPVVTVGSNTPCVNQALNLSSSGGTSYSWSGPNAFSSTQQNPTITGSTQSNSGSYAVIVTDANSCVSSGTVSVTVNPLPVVTANGATVCVGATINLSSTGGVSYSWSGPNLYSSNQQNPSITSAATNMSGNYAVTVTDANGCSNANIASVTVNPSLIISASNNSPICQNGTLNLTASTGVSWSWSGPNGFGSMIQNPNIAMVPVNATGTYTVVGTDANGCQGTATTMVTVNPLPTVTATSATICISQQTASLAASGASSYSWTPSTGLSSSMGTSVTGTPSVSTVYTVTGTDANNCVNTGTTSITVNPLPNVTVNSATICIGNSAPLTAAGAQSYSWTPAVGLSSSTGNSVTANPTSNISYTVTGTDANGCYDYANTSVTVNPLPIITVNPASICAGSSAVLTAQGANNYVWSPGGSSGSGISASPASTMVYTITGTDMNGCSNITTAMVTVNPLPVVTASPLMTSGCAPVCVSLINSSSVTGNCNWAFGDGSTSAGCAPAHCFSAQGTYNPVLTLTDGNGCTGTASVTVVVYPVPDADFEFGPEPPITMLDPTVHFYDITTGAPVTSWSWTFGDAQNSSSILQNPEFMYESQGSYQVQLSVSTVNGCKDSTIKIVNVSEDFMLYVPNAFTPNSDKVNDVFMARGQGIKDFKMYIFDRWGNQVFFTDDIDKGWDGSMNGKGDDVLQEDLYVWKVELKTFKNDTRQVKGSVSLIK